jgi:hypothetical protein
MFVVLPGFLKWCWSVLKLFKQSTGSDRSGKRPAKGSLEELCRRRCSDEEYDVVVDVTFWWCGGHPRRRVPPFYHVAADGDRTTKRGEPGYTGNIAAATGRTKETRTPGEEAATAGEEATTAGEGGTAAEDKMARGRRGPAPANRQFGSRKKNVAPSKRRHCDSEKSNTVSSTRKGACNGE